MSSFGYPVTKYTLVIKMLKNYFVTGLEEKGLQDKRVSGSQPFEPRGPPTNFVSRSQTNTENCANGKLPKLKCFVFISLKNRM